MAEQWHQLLHIVSFALGGRGQTLPEAKPKRNNIVGAESWLEQNPLKEGLILPLRQRGTNKAMWAFTSSRPYVVNNKLRLNMSMAHHYYSIFDNALVHLKLTRLPNLARVGISFINNHKMI